MRIPSTIDGAVSKLTGIDKLVTAKNWERAAIVYAFVDVSPTAGAHIITSDKLSPEQFAARDIAGLRSPQTVRKVWREWKHAIDAGQAETIGPGDEFIEPALPYPPKLQLDRRERDAAPELEPEQDDGYRDVFGEADDTATVGNDLVDTNSDRHGDAEAQAIANSLRTISRQILGVFERVDPTDREKIAERQLLPAVREVVHAVEVGTIKLVTMEEDKAERSNVTKLPRLTAEQRSERSKKAAATRKANRANEVE